MILRLTIARLDHLVLTVRDIDATSRFFARALGMEIVEFGDGRIALEFGNQKINLHLAGHEISQHAERPTPGSADLCFVIEGTLDEAIAHLQTEEIEVLLGPVARTGALGPIRSAYFRDPDGNLIEIAEYGSSRE